MDKNSTPIEKARLLTWFQKMKLFSSRINLVLKPAWLMTKVNSLEQQFLIWRTYRLHWPVAEELAVHQMHKRAVCVEMWVGLAPAHQDGRELSQLEILDVLPGQEFRHLLLDLLSWRRLHLEPQRFSTFRIRCQLQVNLRFLFFTLTSSSTCSAVRERDACVLRVDLYTEKEMTKLTQEYKNTTFFQTLNFSFRNYMVSV